MNHHAHGFTEVSEDPRSSTVNMKGWWLALQTPSAGAVQETTQEPGSGGARL